MPSKQNKNKLKYKPENFKSNFETEIYKQLVHDIRPKWVQFGYEITKIPYTTVHNYKPDWTLTNTKTGKTIHIECKGYLRPEDIAKMRILNKQHPDLDIRFLFWTNNKLNARSSTRYDEWAYKNGYKFAFRTIPQEWLDELLNDTPSDS